MRARGENTATARTNAGTGSSRRAMPSERNRGGVERTICEGCTRHWLGFEAGLGR